MLASAPSATRRADHVSSRHDYQLDAGGPLRAIPTRRGPRPHRQGLEALAPDLPFEAEFSEDIVAELYERRAGARQIFAGFAVLAVVIGCLGLFGLAAFTAERRTKEIGIRKVLGARTQRHRPAARLAILASR